ncbi:hypothetical protein BXZ70DRAFT_1006485 [Cristinia sonorae]|uniref:Uncharacterized protein n=1 Tax=Cristinia sonorae TaxID=1940300 RepID=A0A8K0XS45_9AGAR|nr:hypothetical protein BXZ70DRAFT_1006485 [Cristinia sonorae]
MEQGAVTQRKLSRGSSRGFFSRKSSKKADSQSLNQTTSVGTVADDRASVTTGKGKEEGRIMHQDHTHARPQFPARSIVPDPLNELPPWYTQAADDVPTTAAAFRTKYPMHNPVGPRWYKNWHLAPSSLDNRPPSLFSPSFPPMAASTDRVHESKMPGPSRTPSGSPLPTPTSSQTRIHDVRVRTRKVSLTAHDNVDMLDGTDPWGTNWHHQSPYDLGSDRVSPETTSESPVTSSRPRRMSFNTGSRHKTTIPSPLSQSTSAVNLQGELPPPRIPRRISKNRKPFNDLFTGPPASGQASKRISEPPLLHPPDRPLKRGSSTGPSLSSGAPSLSDKEKRGSILGRLAKRFSVMRKPDHSRGTTSNSVETGSLMSDRRSMNTMPVSSSRSTPSPQKPPLHHTKSSDVGRRIPPPSVHDVPLTPASEAPPKDEDIDSVTSFEEHRMRTLTIANPDEPGPPTPAEDVASLPVLPDVEAGANFGGDHFNGMLGVPRSTSPHPMEVPDTPIQHRLSTILSVGTGVDAPGTSPSPPLPELPPMTPSVVHHALSEPPLPPTPEGTRPGTPSEAVSPLPPSPTPASPPLPASPVPASPPIPASPVLSNGTTSREALSFAMSPSAYGASLDDIPLSRASMLVEPPTPHPPTVIIPPQSQAPPMPSPEQVLQRIGDDKVHRDTSPSKRDSQRVKGSSSSTKSRQTETFKLVRSPSGNIHTVGETFMVEGEHWEVVADEKKGRREPSKGPDTETVPSRRESRKADRSNGDDTSEKKSHDRHRRSVNGKSGSEHTGRSSTYSDETVKNSSTERRRASTKERDRERHRDSKGESSRSTQTPVNPTQSKPTSTRRERRTSSSATRPSSEFQSVADINTLKAKDAWDLERLWKGRSMMYGPDGTTIVSNRPTIGSDSRPSTIMSPDLHRATSIPSVGEAHRASASPATHGSSHTYFMVQTPANGLPYDPYTPGQQPKSTTTRNSDYTKLYRSFPDSVPFPSNSHSDTPLPNPLPDPPRLSVYKAAPLPASLAGPGDGPSSSEYWTKYAGVAATTTNH